MQKFIYGVYDSKGQLRYIGATTRPSTADLHAQIIRQMKQADVEIKRGKLPNPRETLFMSLLKVGSLKIKFLTAKITNWKFTKKQLIQRARDKKLPIVNVAKGGDGSEGVHVKTDSLEKAQLSRSKISDEDAYQMHTLWRVKNWTQSRIACHYGISEKGAQKILRGDRRANVLTAWERDNPGYKKAG